MKLRILLIGLIGSLLWTGASAQLIMEGDYVRTGISANGTLGYGSSAEPGLRHDPSGTRTWGSEDYLTPGSPWEIFSVRSSQTGLLVNNNTSPSGGSMVSTSGGAFSVPGSAFDQHVRWEGTYSGFFNITHDYFFNLNYERIDIQTTITALTDLSSFSLLRAIDPDPDANTYGSYSTVNTRGATGIAAEDFVNSQGPITGLTLGLYSDSSVTHNTGISSSWSQDPNTYLAGLDSGNGDNTIGLAFLLGDLVSGDSETVNYSYVMGGTLETVDIPPAVAVPEPSTYGLIGAGMLVALVLRRRLKQKASQVEASS